MKGRNTLLLKISVDHYMASIIVVEHTCIIVLHVSIQYNRLYIFFSLHASKIVNYTLKTATYIRSTFYAYDEYSLHALTRNFWEIVIEIPMHLNLK